MINKYLPHTRTSATKVPMWYLPHTRTSATIHASLSAAVYHVPHGGCKDYRVIVDIMIAVLPHTRTSATRVPMWYLPPNPRHFKWIKCVFEISHCVVPVF